MVPFQPALLDTFRISLLDGTFLIAGACVLPTPLLLPVDMTEVDGGLAIIFPLIFQTFMADPDIQPAPLIGPVLHFSPLFTPKRDIFSLVMLSVFLRTETVRPDHPGWNDDMDMGVVLRRIKLISPFVNRRDHREPLRREIRVDILADNPDQLLSGQFIWQGTLELPGSAGIAAFLGPVNLIAEMLEVVVAGRCVDRLVDLAVENIRAAMIIGPVVVAVVELVSADVVGQLRN